MLLIGLLLGPATAIAQSADGPSGRAEQVRREVARLIEQLDSDRFETRGRATERLKQLSAQPELRSILADQIQRVLVLPEISFEVRQQLEPLRRELPHAESRPAEEASREEICRLVTQLEDDSYGLRLGATKRLEWLLENPKLAYPIFCSLKRRLREPQLPADALSWLEPVYDQARGAWLATDPAQDDLPPITTEQITTWIGQLVQPISPGEPSSRRRDAEMAQRELQDVLARDDYVPEVKRLLESRLAAGNLDPGMTAGLNELLELTFPAMVAEFWQAGQNQSIQHLLVGVPSFYPDGVSHFDHIDDKVAHCVSGVSLSPGDYPVGVGIPHPKRETALFQLVNLPTPRRRMAYEYYAKTDQAARLVQLSRRTLDRLLARKQSLSKPELVMLSQLDAGEVSRFAAEYFHLVADQPLPVEGPLRATGRPSRHGMLCGILASRGTREAADGLLRAIEQGRFLAPKTEAAYRLPWIAALSIAARDPWPGADAWLASLISRPDQLVIERVAAPELGATAAASLLGRYHESPADFGLEASIDPFFAHIEMPGYRFASDAARGKVQAWWAEQTDHAPEAAEK